MMFGIQVSYPTPQFIIGIPANRKRVVAVSFPRDLAITPLECQAWDASTGEYGPVYDETTGSYGPDQITTETKLNSAYSLGGPKCLVKAIQKMSGLSINRFMAVDFNGFAKMVDACVAAGIKPFYGPFGDIADLSACEQQFRNAFLMGCAGAWSLHPNQIDIAKRVFSPDPAEVKFALRILEVMPDGSGVAMLDGKMQDDATWKQAKVIVDLAKQVAAKDPDMAKAYGL